VTEPSTETLHRAARLMRERAKAATTGEPWMAFQNDGALYGIDLKPSLDPVTGFGEVATTGMGNCPPGEDPRFLFAHHERAEHIASWHPSVALAVARWLDDAAFDAVGYGGDADPALEVARTYLGEVQP